MKKNNSNIGFTISILMLLLGFILYLGALFLVGVNTTLYNVLKVVGMILMYSPLIAILILAKKEGRLNITNRQFKGFIIFIICFLLTNILKIAGNPLLDKIALLSLTILFCIAGFVFYKNFYKDK